MPDSIEPEWSNTFRAGHTMPCLPCKSECLSAESSTATFRNNETKLDPPNRSYVDQAQSTAIERLVRLKQELRMLDDETFWNRFMETITSICGAQYAFVARRVPDSEPVGGLGGRRPSLFGFAFYYNDGHQTVGMHRNRYFVGGNPLSHMDHDKPCLITENMASFTSFGLDKLPFAVDGYMAVPLFSDRKCLAHLGLMWSESGLRKSCLPWPFIEMILYSLEDLVVQRIRDASYQKLERHQQDPKTMTTAHQNIVDSHATLLHGSTEFSSQPLKPYARSLSHELRTPMQGVVGMLDVMHATVREALDGKPSTKTGVVLQSLKENIEMVQDSARRAVEAADNVVHAYDLNMQVPQTPQIERDNEFFGPPSQSPVTPYDGRPNIFIERNNITVNPYKRRRSNPPEFHAPQPKQKIIRMSSRKGMSPRSEEVKNAVHESDKIVHATPARQIEAVMANMVDPRPSLAARRSAPHLLLEGINVNLKGPAVRCTKLRDLLRLVINESLHVGGRPEFAVSDTTDLGESIEIRSQSSNGETVSKIINWSVDSALPDTLLVDDRDLAKLISCVFLNAVKFTNSGTITVSAAIGGKANDVLIAVRDTGPGIPEAFLPKLFKPFTREDASITRSKEGLGLGLLVAKGLARKMGGDLVCVRSCTSGPDHGSVFEIRVPVNQPGASKGPVTPAGKILTPPQFVDPSCLSSGSTGSSSSFLSPSARISSQPIQQPSPSLTDEPSSQTSTPVRPSSSTKPARIPTNGDAYDSSLGQKHPLKFLVAEDNHINRRVLVNMLRKLGYHGVYEACNGKEAVRIMQGTLGSHHAAAMPHPPCSTPNSPGEFPIPDTGNHNHGEKKNLKPVDIILMDLWMPEMDGYEATSRILQLIDEYHGQVPPDPRHPTSSTDTSATLRLPPSPTVLAVSADVTDEALGRASKVGMKGYMTKPYKLSDLERLIVEFCGDT